MSGQQAAITIAAAAAATPHAMAYGYIAWGALGIALVIVFAASARERCREARKDRDER